MSAGFSWSPRLAWSALLAASAAGLAGAIRAAEVSRLQEAISESAARAAALSTRIGALSPFDDTKLEALLEESRRFDSLLGPGDSWDKLMVLLGARWTVESTAKDVAGGFTSIVGTLRLSNAAPVDWREVLSAIDRARRLPGASVVSVELRMRAADDPPAVGVVRMGVSVRVRNG